MGRKGFAKENLGLLSDEELRNSLLENSGDQLSILTNISYYLFIKNSIDLIAILKDKDFLDQIPGKVEKDKILEYFGHIMDLFARINDPDVEIDIENEKDLLLDLRKEYYDMLEVLQGYEMETLYIGELLDYYIVKAGEEEAANINMNEFEIWRLINWIEDILHRNATDYEAYTHIISKTLGLLPFRMSKFKYFDILHDTLMRNFENYPVSIAEEWIEEYKKIFDNTLHNNYGIMFDDYFTAIQGFRSRPIEKLEADQLEDINQDIMELFWDMREVKGLLIDIGVNINRLMIMLLNKDRILDFKKEAVQIFKYWLGEVEETSIQSLKEEVEKEWDRWDEKLVINSDRLAALHGELSNREGPLSSDLSQKLSPTRETLIYYNDTVFSKYEMLFPQSEDRITQDYLEQLVDSLIQYIDRSVANMGNIERKIRMRRLLSVPELPFKNLDEFLTHVEHSLDERIVPKGEILYSMEMLTNWLDEFEGEN
ncbi:MAG TPA: hypothetical protein GXX70_06455 [Tepidimicrobium sp.]|nr:hypothetical protein [Tepidimicrobium sp.]